MARRFGGQFSNGGATDAPQSSQNQAPQKSAWSGRTVQRWTGRLTLVSVAAFPMLAAGLLELGSGDALQAVGELAAFAAMAGGVWLTREGLKAEDAYAARTVAHAPRAPRKIAGAAAMGVGVALGAAVGWELGVVQGIVYGAVAACAHVAAFGLDPMRAKGSSDISDFDRDRVAGAVDKAEALLADLIAQAGRVRDRNVAARVDSFAAAARDMFRRIEEDPRDLAGARRYLGVYLSGARDATAQFADLWTRAPETAARQDYLALLDDLEMRFNAKSATLIENDRSALDIEIEVLRDRLQQEGVRPRKME